jgi:hypothetical protein
LRDSLLGLLSADLGLNKGDGVIKMKKIELSHRMYAIHDLKRLYDSKEVVVQPKYQRRRTEWPLNAKTSLIDTIVNNYTIPPIYIRSYVDSKRQRRTEIIDGQQRVTTIMEFLNGDFALTSTFSDQELVGLTFQELPPDIQDSINDYELSCMAIRGATESDIITIFSRVNSFSLPLNPQEKRNAIYAGEFKTTVYDIASKYYTFWRSFNILSNAAIARMKDAELVSELFSVIMNGLSGVKEKELDELYEKYDGQFPNRVQYENMFTRIVSFFGTLFDNNDNIRSHFRKISWFFPLFLVFYIKSYGPLGSNNLSIQTQPNLDDIAYKLTSFIDNYKSSSLSDDIRLLFQQGSRAPSKIEQRLEYLLSVIDGS